MADIEGPAQEAGLIGRRKRNPCVQMGVTPCPDNRPGSARMADRVASTETPPQLRASAAATALWSRVGGDQRPAPSTTTLETTNGEGSALIGQRRQLITPAAMPCPASGMGQRAPCAPRPWPPRRSRPSLPLPVANPRRICRCARGPAQHDIPRWRPAPRSGARSLRE